MPPAGDHLKPTIESRHHAAHARAECIRLLYQQSTVALGLSVFVAALWAALMWHAADRFALYCWIASIAVATLARAALFWGYFRRKPDGNDLLRWEWPYTLTLMPAVLTWGVGCVLVMPAHSLLHQVITFGFLIGMAGMAISTYGSRPQLTMIVIATLLIPITIIFVVGHTRDTDILAITGLLSIIGTSRGVAIHGKAVDENYRLRHELHDAYRISDREARTDHLTGVLNRRAFLNTAEAVLEDRPPGTPRCPVIVFDVDDFKQINDQYGHAAGDATLCHIAGAVSANLRRSDIFGRLGGDEFAILLPGTTLDEALAVAKKFSEVCT